MTVEQVKRDLPDVMLKLGKNVLRARISGRLCPSATVTVSYVDSVDDPTHYLRGEPWLDFHFSWEAVARAVTTGEPLNIG